MGDLMNDRSKMEDLYSKYQGFQAPAVKILLGEGKTDLINRLNARIDGLTVNLSLETAASVSFTIVNAYDSKKHSFSSGIMDQLALGSIVRSGAGVRVLPGTDFYRIYLCGQGGVQRYGNVVGDGAGCETRHGGVGP